jgi:hypothetical protein
VTPLAPGWYLIEITGHRHEFNRVVRWWDGVGWKSTGQPGRQVQGTNWRVLGRMTAMTEAQEMAEVPDAAIPEPF